MEPRLLSTVGRYPFICEALKSRLEAIGYTIIVAHDEQSGLTLIALEAKHAPICGVLLDLQMPIINGVQVLRDFRVHN